MSDQPIQCNEERVAFERDGLMLSGVLAYPAEGEPECAVLLCPPHPNFAGDMNNNVIEALARALAPPAAVLRFDYHGIGASQISLPPGLSLFDYWLEVEESRDDTMATRDAVSAANFLAAAAPGLELIIAGYSFGSLTGMRAGLADPRVTRMVGIAPPLSRVDFAFLASCPKDCLLLAGGRDFVCSEKDLDELAARAGPRVRTEILPEDDHFFRGREDAVARRVQHFLGLPPRAARTFFNPMDGG